MDNLKEDTEKKQTTKTKTTKCRDKKQRPRNLFRRKSLKSMGSLVNKIFRTLGTLTHFKDFDLPDAEDDDGGFRESTPCNLTASSGNFKGDIQVVKDRILKKSVTLTSHGSIKERLSCCYGERTPGVLGLKNHGNTCFMNAVIQCLSNTDIFAEYLGLELYKSDFNKSAHGILNDDAKSARGEVTEQLASLVKALWILEYTPQLSVEFKNTVSKYSSQFRGNSQQDALEFLLWLLDRVHEDVNPSPIGSNRKTKAAALEPAGEEETPMLRAVTPPQREVQGGPRSFVQEHFQAQYKSSLTCPHCLKQSHTFDPFLCISLPIPLRQTRHVFVTLVFSTRTQRYLRVGLALPLHGSLACLRRMVADEGKISPEQVILTEIYPTGFQRSFFDEDDLSSIAESDVIYAFQAPPFYGRAGLSQFSGNHHSLPSSPYSSGPEGQRSFPSGAVSSEFLNCSGSAKILLLICNTAGAGQQAQRFGPPFLLREDRSTPWHQLQQCIVGKLSYLMLNGALIQNAGVLFDIRVVGGSATCSYLSPQDGRPLYHSTVDRALKFCRAGGPPHVKLIVEWDPKLKERVFGNLQEELIQDAESVRSQQEKSLQQHSCTLEECFQLYTKEEELAPDNAWKCPHCEQLQQGRVKMKLWTLPTILILHLKRFRQAGERRHKLCTLVRFPLSGLDMGPHAVKRGPWPHPPRPPPGPHQPRAPPGPGSHPDFLYDLYAVCNHHGGMHGGHYTAYCRNSMDGQWYCYDDSNVDLLPEGEICTRGAYILFYQKRNTIPPWSASCSNRGSSSSSASDHWLVRLTGGSKRGSLASWASSACPTQTLSSHESPVFHPNPPEAERGGFESRPLVRGVQIMGTPTRSKAPPLRQQLGLRNRHRSAPDSTSSPAPPPLLATRELVEYLESGRRPRYTTGHIFPLMAHPPEEAEQYSPPTGRDQAGSIRAPTGQGRPLMEKGSGLRVDTDLPWMGSKMTEQIQPTTKNFCDGLRDFGMENWLDGTPAGASELKRDWGASRTGGGEEDREKGGHDGGLLLSFLWPSFFKRDVSRRQRKGTDGSPNRLALSNGELNTGSAEGKLTGAPCDEGTCCGELANGGAGWATTDIRRSQSSSNIHAKLQGSASLHKKDPAAAPPQNPACTALLRPCQSTTSLGSKRPVSESRF